MPLPGTAPGEGPPLHVGIHSPPEWLSVSVLVFCVRYQNIRPVARFFLGVLPFPSPADIEFGAFLT